MRSPTELDSSQSLKSVCLYVIVSTAAVTAFSVCTNRVPSAVKITTPRSTQLPPRSLPVGLPALQYPMPVLKRKLSNPFNMNGNNSNRSASATALRLDLGEVEHLIGLLVSPSAGANVEDNPQQKQSRSRKNSAPTEMSTVVERRTTRSSRFNLGGGKRNAAGSPTTPKKKKGLQISAQKDSKLDKIDVEKLKKWEVSFSAMLESPDGIELFEDYLKSEFSDENIQFWKACERFKTLPEHKLEKEAEAMFEEFVAPHAPKMVNLDYQTTQDVKKNMKQPNNDSFSGAQHAIYLLMARDSFVRFVNSEPFQQALVKDSSQ